MAQEKITLRYARLIGRIELLASALVTSGDPKLLEQDQKLFFQIEDDLAKIDLTSLPEAKVASLEEVVALLPKDNSFYGQEESAALSYIALLIRECFVKNKSLNADFHQKKLAAIAALGARQEDERKLKETQHKIEVLKKNAPSPSSFQRASYEKSLEDLESQSREISAKIYKI